MGKLIAYCKICGEEIIRIPVKIEFPSLHEKEKAQMVISAAAAHLTEEHRKDDVTAYPHNVFWRTIVEGGGDESGQRAG